MADRTVSAPCLVAAIGGVCTLSSFLVPWATRTTTAYGDEGTVHLRAWSDQGLLTVGVFVIALVIVVVSAYSLVAEHQRGLIEATLLTVLGTIVVALVVTWTLVVIAQADPDASFPGFQRSQTLPTIGVGAAAIGGFVTAVAGFVERVQRSLTVR